MMIAHAQGPLVSEKFFSLSFSYTNLNQDMTPRALDFRDMAGRIYVGDY